jgi:DNA-directed RNA polymerase III subunit RPC3
MEITELRFGAVARDIVQNLLLLGHTKIADLIEAYRSKWSAQEIHDGNGHGNIPTLTNGIQNWANGNPDVTRLHNLDDVLCRLLEAELIEPVVESIFLSPSDTYHKVEREILHSHFGGSTKGTKQKDDLKSKVIDGLRAIRHQRKIWAGKGNKRPANGVHTNGPQKRQKLANGINNRNGTPHEYQDECKSLNVSSMGCSGKL